jgi:hypothetical protein
MAALVPRLSDALVPVAVRDPDAPAGSRGAT